MNQAWPVGVLVTILASALGLVFWMVSGATAGVLTYLIAAYTILVMLAGLDLVTVPSRKLAIFEIFSEDEQQIYRTYHTFIMFPFAGMLFSATLSVLRLGSVGWALLALFGRAFLPGLVLILFGLFSTPVLIRFSPIFNLRPLAARNDADAAKKLSLLESVLAKRNGYNLGVS